MSTPTEAIREQLVASNSEYQRLQEEHACYSAEIEKLSSKAYLTEQEKIEEVRLKKLKLHLKDQMAAFLRKASAGD